jgi:exodeoxyribonuclease-3
MRITTWNVNGLRAALRKDFAHHLEQINPDVLLLQEIRVTPDLLPEEWREPVGWHVSWHPAEKPGYAGTAAWTRNPHRVVSRGLASRTHASRTTTAPDPQGRVLRIEVESDSGQTVQAVSAYLPSGSASPESQVRKEAWMAAFMPWAMKLRRTRAPVVLAGDLNIAHTPRDLYYAKSNARQSGFLPHEREWFTRLLSPLKEDGAGWHDPVRHQHGDVDGPYSWWSNRGQARTLDRGWRIDYTLTNPAATGHVTDTVTHRAAALAREDRMCCSDHAPVSVDLTL